MSVEEEPYPGEEKLKQDVQRALCDVLGGQKFIRAGCYSTYFYDIGNSFLMLSRNIDRRQNATWSLRLNMVKY